MVKADREAIMTDQELFTKNLKLSTEFDLYLFEHPEVAEQIPENALVVLLPEEDPDLCKRNIELAKARQESGQAVVHVWIEKVAPPRSRLVRSMVVGKGGFRRNLTYSCVSALRFGISSRTRPTPSSSARCLRHRASGYSQQTTLLIQLH
jgi:hypothetical protein